MKYSINTDALRTPFMLPADAVDKYIKLAGGTQLKVLLYVFRHFTEEISAEDISAHLNIPLPETEDAFLFWADAGILCADGEKASRPQEENTKKTVRAATVKPTRAEVARRGNEDEKITFLLREAEQKMGRALRQSEASTLVWLYDDEGMSVSVILMLLEFAINENKANIGFVERTAVEWLNSGVKSISEAEDKINEMYNNRSCWRRLCRAFGIDDRLPSTNEQKYAVLWIDEWKMSVELLREAYNRCVDAIGKMQMKYIAAILEKWHKDGVKKVSDIKDDKKENESFAAYDKSVFNDMLSAIDDE